MYHISYDQLLHFCHIENDLKNLLVKQSPRKYIPVIITTSVNWNIALLAFPDSTPDQEKNRTIFETATFTMVLSRPCKVPLSPFSERFKFSICEIVLQEKIMFDPLYFS